MKKLIICVIMLSLFGIALFLFPTISNYLNERNQTTVISDYNSIVENTNNDTLDRYLTAADHYNQQLFLLQFPLLEYNKIDGYDNLLNLNNDGVMGYLFIDKINLKLPIYHGTSKDVLSVGCGHLKGSSLPVGGKNTHSVISGHTGLSTAKLFSDLNKLQIGDELYILVLTRKLTYVIDQILTVRPDDTQNIAIIKGEDYCTLSTCTPYGINTYRRLVRGRNSGYHI